MLTIAARILAKQNTITCLLATERSLTWWTLCNNRIVSCREAASICVNSANNLCGGGTIRYGYAGGSNALG